MSERFEKSRHAANPRRPLGNIRGEGGERLSEYFDFKRYPEKAAFRVTRIELLAILEQHFRATEARRLSGFLRRVWRFLTRPLGSKITDETGVESPEVNKP